MGDPALPAWLGRPEAYDPPGDRDKFIEKSILSFAGTLAGARERSGGRAVSRLHPVLPLLGGLGFILLVSLARSVGFLEAAGTVELVALSLLDGRRIAAVLRTGLVAAVFAAVVFLPSALAGNWAGAAVVTAKVLLSSVAAMLVSAASGWTAIARGLSALRLPDTFVLVLDLAVKYISLLGGLVLDMLHALKLRSVGRNEDKASSLAGIAGTTFLKSREAAEELLAAMECRCFSGEYRVGKARGLRAPDFAFLAGAALLVLAFCLLPGGAA